MKLAAKTLLACTAAAAFVGSAQAAPIFQESFDYSPSDPANDGLASFSDWFNKEQGDDSRVNTPGLVYGVLPTSGGRMVHTGNAGYTRNEVATTLSNAGLLNDGATLWMSVVLQSKVSSNANVAIRLGDTFVDQNSGIDSGGSDSVGVHIQNGSDIQARYHHDGGLVNGGTVVNNSSLINPVLVVVEMIWNADNNQADTLNYYTPGTDLTIGTVKRTVDSVTFNQTTFDTFSISVSNSNSTEVDEIRFGASYNDVITNIPEPGSLALLGLGGLLIARRRRG